MESNKSYSHDCRHLVMLLDRCSGRPRDELPALSSIAAAVSLPQAFPAFCASVPTFARSSTVIALAMKLTASDRFEGMIRVLPAFARSLNAPT